MKVLIACEESGTVRDAFRSRGVEAYSCDIRYNASPYHIQGDVLEILNDGWDLMIAHPPCTHLATSGARWFPEKIADGRQEEAVGFALRLWNAPIPKVALENPVSILSTRIRKPDQIINPWQFGDSASKRTCLWLRNLPHLESTEIVHKGEYITTKSGKRIPKWYNLPPSPERASIRSKTFLGIAQAMATQWVP
jgi:hypothetical protein